MGAVITTILEHILAAKAALWQSYCFIFDPESKLAERLCDIVDRAWIRIVLQKLPLVETNLDEFGTFIVVIIEKSSHP